MTSLSHSRWPMRYLASFSGNAIGSSVSRGGLSRYATASMAAARIQARPIYSGLQKGLSSGTSSNDVSRSTDQQLLGSVAKLDVPSAAGLFNTHKDRCAYLYVPPTYAPDKPSALLVMLHGAGGYAKNTMLTFGSLDVFDRKRCLLLVPESRGSTWDMIRGDFGPDVRFINAAMQHVFERYSVDPQRCALAGFSDGASYALSLGLPNGDLFSHIIAFSPGFMRAPSLAGSPKVYISHGTSDQVLNIDFCSRRLMPRLSQVLPAEAELNYVEFEGGHSVTSRVAGQALSWFLEGGLIEDNTFSQGPHVPA